MPSQEARRRYDASPKRAAATKRASEKRAAARAAIRATRPPPIGRPESRRKWAEANRNDYLLRARYKLTQAEVEVLKSRTHCAICGRDDMRLVTDHKHEPHQVRDRLCRYCNIMVGVLEHSNFQKAVDYLAHWNSMLPD